MINKRLYTNLTIGLGVLLALSIPVYLLVRGESSGGSNKSVHEAQFVGSESCKECHKTEYDLWRKSDHFKSMAVANDSTVLGDFSNAQLQSNGQTHKMYKRDGKFFVFTDGEDGTMQEFEVKYVFGYTPLQQYLVELDRGRRQTLALTWHTTGKKWYHMADHVYKGQNIDHNNWLHWTNQGQNWNGMCADCHSTNVVKGYDVNTDSYHTTYDDINVGCETCHGPSSSHIDWARQPEYARSMNSNFDLLNKTSNITSEEMVDGCARCHAHRVSLGDMEHGAKSIYDHIIPNLPTAETWHIDGQIKEEVFEYASFLQSKMYMKGIKCNDCHNVHSGERHFEGNRLCHQCHQPNIYDTPAHHFHKSEGMTGDAVISEAGIKFEVGSGTQCVNCHMHGQYYMGVDYRHDHSFRIPRPDLSVKHGTPNACNQCHANKTPQWADENVQKWFGKSRRFHYSEAFVGATKGNPSASNQLKSIAKDNLYPHNVRALALQFQASYFPDSVKGVIDQYINNLNPTYRVAAARNLPIQNSNDIALLLPLLNDETKAVRTEAARVLSTVPLSNIPENYKLPFDNAFNEYKSYLEYNGDFPIGKFNLGNLYYNLGDLQQAEKYYNLAIQQDSELHFIQLNLAYLYNKLGQNDKAELYFRQYLKQEPNDGNATYSFALLLSEIKKYDEALEYLLKAAALLPNSPRINHNIAMMFEFKGDLQKTETYLKKEIAVSKSTDSNAALLDFYLKNNQKAKAKALAIEMLKSNPQSQELKQLVDQL